MNNLGEPGTPADSLPGTPQAPHIHQHVHPHIGHFHEPGIEEAWYQFPTPDNSPPNSPNSQDNKADYDDIMAQGDDHSSTQSTPVSQENKAGYDEYIAQLNNQT